MLTKGRILNLYTLNEDEWYVRTKCVVVAIDDDSKAIETGKPLLGATTSDEILSVGVVGAIQIQNLKMKQGDVREFPVGVLPETKI